MQYLKKNVGFILMMIFFAAVILVPDFKAALLKGFLKVGLFKPNVDKPTVAMQGALSLAPDIVVVSSEGQQLNLARPNGKVVFLNFWATWCPPCIAEMPSIQSLKEKIDNKESVIFAMVDADNNLPASVAFMTKNNYTMPVFGQTSSIPESLFNGSLPTTVIINKQGEIVMRHEGLGNYDTPEMVKFINQLSE